MNTKNRIIGTLVSAGTTLTMVIGLGVGVANADPIAAPTSRLLAISGSDTTDEVMQALAEDATALISGGNRAVENWSAAGGGNIAPHGGTLCSITRPTGSSGGRTALLNSIGATATTPNCFQGARSSSLNLATVATTDKQLVYVPFAKEAVTYAVTNTSNVSRNQTVLRLQQFYRCENSSGVEQTNPATKVMLPQSTSGTRQYWLTQLLGSTAPATIGDTIVSNTTTGVISSGCVEDGADEFGAVIQEHQGGKVNDNELVPYSVGQWTSQASGVIGENRGRTILAQIATTNPYTSGAFYQRTLYNVFPAAYIGGSSTEATAVQALFFGSGSALCTTAAAITSRYGLIPAPDCGATTSITPLTP